MQNIIIGGAYLASLPGLTDVSNNLSNASGTPVVTVRHNGVVDTTAGFVAVNAGTGLYDVNGTVPTADSSSVAYANGDKCSVHWNATMPDGSTVGGTLEPFTVGVVAASVGPGQCADVAFICGRKINSNTISDFGSGGLIEAGLYNDEPYYAAPANDRFCWHLGGGMSAWKIGPTLGDNPSAEYYTDGGAVSPTAVAWVRISDGTRFNMFTSSTAIPGSPAAALLAAFPNAPNVGLTSAALSAQLTAWMTAGLLQWTDGTHTAMQLTALGLALAPSGGISKQDVADAGKLAPAAGTPAAGSSLALLAGTAKPSDVRLSMPVTIAQG